MGKREKERNERRRRKIAVIYLNSFQVSGGLLTVLVA